MRVFPEPTISRPWLRTIPVVLAAVAFIVLLWAILTILVWLTQFLPVEAWSFNPIST